MGCVALGLLSIKYMASINRSVFLLLYLLLSLNHIKLVLAEVLLEGTLFCVDVAAIAVNLLLLTGIGKVTNTTVNCINQISYFSCK